MRTINRIIIHCADTPASMDVGAEEIRRWHTEERGWNDIGYHYVIRRSGAIEKGREDSVQGAHVAGQNSDSLGVCLVGGQGGFNFTMHQILALLELLDELMAKYDIPLTRVSGHTEWDEGKQCPQFDVRAFLTNPNTLKGLENAK